MIFDTMTYNWFYMERLSQSHQQKNANHIRFTKEEIEWAVQQADYKYFGSYEFSDQQKMAMEIILWVTKESLRAKELNRLRSKLTLEQIVELLQNQAIDGEFTNKDHFVLSWLLTLNKLEKEIIMACYSIGFNDRFEGDEE